jgi:hypothetical protein
MRVYITRCGEEPATIDDGEIAIASNAELHAAPLSAKRLLALWNALPGVEKRKKVGDREALINQLWAAIEMLPEPEPPSDAKRVSKQGRSLPCCAVPLGVSSCHRLVCGRIV